LSFAALVVCVCLEPRLRLEAANATVAVVADYREVLPLAEAVGLSPKAALEYLKGKGLGGVMIRDYSPEDLQKDITTGGRGPKRTGPDREGLNAAAEADMPVFYRVAPAPAWRLKEALETARGVFSAYRNIAVAAPSGDVVLGYPNLVPLASLLKEFSMPVAWVEFSRQLGAARLEELMSPHIIPLHSVTNEELLVRRISRSALRERLVRAAVERSVRLLIFRPSTSGGGGSALHDFGAEVERLADDLRAHGLRIGWPEAVFAKYPPDGAGISAMFARYWPERPYMYLGFFLPCSIFFFLAAFRYAGRIAGKPMFQWENRIIVPGSFLLAVAAALVPPLARWLGALTAVFVVTEASLLAMDNPKRLWRPLLSGVLYAFVGGLAIATLFSEPSYMLRLRTFSGVKLTLMLPPLLVLLHDMHRRVHPESLSAFLSRPPLWGELFLGSALLAGLVVALFRSDNVQFIPGVETQIRAALERFLVARPRSKEVFIGYPCLLLWAFAARAGLWARCREALRVGVAVGFSSVVNSFCHYHTPLLFILLREFHGLWTGVLLGAAAVAAVKYVALPLWKRSRFLAE
jgi:hypothetical protein